ncbi:hypothetical protein SAMN05519103_05901 [Rhizobiales bacterium GAS113]|nr:hypothetical protein SAMN05519103_05901 [Rhizobiales bacterium GAS113]
MCATDKTDTRQRGTWFHEGAAFRASPPPAAETFTQLEGIPSELLHAVMQCRRGIHIGRSMIDSGRGASLHAAIEVGTVVAFVSGLSTIHDPWGDLITWFQDPMVTSAEYELVTGAVAQARGG